MELTEKFTKIINENMDAAYNMGVSQSIDVVQDVIGRIKQYGVSEGHTYESVLKSTITLLINLKK